MYHDANSNGITDAGDRYIGTQSLAMNAQATQSFNYDIEAPVNMGNVCPLVAIFNFDCSCSPLTVSIPCSPIILPVKFSEARAKNYGCNVMLSWKYEVSYDRVINFEIERSNASVINWQFLGILPESLQSFADQTPYGDQWIYRIKAITQAGDEVYSDVIRITTNCKEAVVQLFPNPARTQLSIVLSGYQEKEVQYTIMDALGRIAQQGLLTGNMINKINVNRLAPGTYQVLIPYGPQIFKSKLIIQKQ